MVEKKSWDEFRKAGLLWLINSTLHLFGWAIVVETEEGVVKNCYPARVKFRGFDGQSNDEGYKSVTDYLAENIDELKKETED
ncbi:MAG TPA: hypothetical protein VGN00_14290 [Puia sp.]|jgi:hypothetical protein